jgi:periplasmic copper chaperone A
MRMFACFALAALCLATLPADARDYRLGDLAIDHPWTRVMPGGRDMGSGYMTIRNDGTASDRLVAASTQRARRVEIHETTLQDDIMRMRHLPDGIKIAPGDLVELKPGGLHIMFLQVTEPFAQGEQIPVTLVFEKAGEITVEFVVEDRGGHGHGHSHGH